MWVSADILTNERIVLELSDQPEENITWASLFWHAGILTKQSQARGPGVSETELGPCHVCHEQRRDK